MTTESIYVLTNTQDTRTYNSNDPADYTGQTNVLGASPNIDSLKKLAQNDNTSKLVWKKYGAGFAAVDIGWCVYRIHKVKVSNP